MYLINLISWSVLLKQLYILFNFIDLFQNEEVGEKNVYYSSKVFIEGEDAESIKEGDLVTFINWGNLRIKKINKEGEKVTSVDALTELDNKDFKKTLKVTWLSEHSAAPFVPTKCVFFDNIITKDVLGKDDNFKDFIGKDTKVFYQTI